jgi:hypothetical protein
LAKAADDLAAQQYSPQISFANNQLDQSGRNRDEALRRLSGYYDKIQAGFNTPANQAVTGDSALRGVSQAGDASVGNVQSQGQKDRLSGIANNLRDYLSNSLNIQSQGLAANRIATGAKAQEHLASSDKYFQTQLANQREKLSALNSAYQTARSANLNSLRDREFNKLATQAQLDTAQQKVLNANTQAELNRALRQAATNETARHNQATEANASRAADLAAQKVAHDNHKRLTQIDTLAATHIPQLATLHPNYMQIIFPNFFSL